MISNMNNMNTQIFPFKKKVILYWKLSISGASCPHAHLFIALKVFAWETLHPVGGWGDLPARGVHRSDQYEISHQ